MAKEKRRMSIWVFLPLLAIILVSFFLVESKLARKNAALKTELEQVRQELVDLDAKKSSLQKELELCTTKEYIENMARTKYNYISKDEKRYVIVNPERIYDDGIVPVR